MNSIAFVGYEFAELEAEARLLAKSLNFKLEQDADTCLFLSAEGLCLKTERFSPLSADFSAKLWSKRRSEGKKQGLIKACKPCSGMKIIDATAGWGRDAAILASFGAEVFMLERNPVMIALLQDALNRQTQTDCQQLKLALQGVDAVTYLDSLKEKDYPDVIYIDPMHPERSKSALVKKDMQILQHMIGADLDALELITLARKRVKSRVVVKWPQKMNFLVSPTSSVEGKTVRFDVYTPNHSKC